MKCPFCAEDNTKVIDSRPADDNSSAEEDSVNAVENGLPHMKNWRRYHWLS